MGGDIPLLPPLCPNDMLRGAVAFRYPYTEDEFGFTGTGVEVPFFVSVNYLVSFRKFYWDVSRFLSELQFNHVCCLSLHSAKAFCRNLAMTGLSTVTYYANSTIYTTLTLPLLASSLKVSYLTNYYKAKTNSTSKCEFYIWVSLHHKSIIYNKPTRCNSGSIVLIKNYKYALHVSDALCVHLQEHYKLLQQPLLFVMSWVGINPV